MIMTYSAITEPGGDTIASSFVSILSFSRLLRGSNKMRSKGFLVLFIAFVGSLSGAGERCRMGFERYIRMPPKLVRVS